MKLSTVYVILSLGLISYLLFVNFRKSFESFCNCFPIIDKRCPDPKVLTSLYSSGKLTEYTDLANIEGSPAPWKTPMPDDAFIEQQSTSCKQ
jgi:hypothetical protein